MRRWVAWLGVVAGCYGPTPQAGLPCAANEACPTGQTCSVGICVLGDGTGSPDARTDGPIDSPDDAPPDAPAPDGPPSDLDADGIENLLDNCPTAQNADQHDEDGDEVGDVCDNCPHVANATQANVMEGSLGADAVGDACDPRPSMPGDTIERFISFHVQPAGVTTQGNWSLSQGAFVKSGLSYAELRIAGVREHYTVEVGGSQITSATAGSWLVLTFGEADNQLHNCGYDELVDDIHDGVLGHYDGTDWNWIYVVNHYLANPLSGPFKIAVTADAAANRASCTTSDSRGTAATGSRTTPSLAPGVIGIRSEDMSYRVDYVIIFGSS